MWADIAPVLAQHFTVVCPDLRGYGDSSKPVTTDDHSPYSKRAMAADQVEVMRRLGHKRFSVVGHDRGARVAHRMALDHGAEVERLAVIDIAPTLTMYERTDMAFAKAYYHWFFLIQPADLPERMIASNVAYYLRWILESWGKTPGFCSDEAYREYLRCLSDPACIHATCEDYRAAASIDLEHDREDIDRKIEVPLLALWGEKGVVARTYDVIEVWRERAADVTGRALPCGHFVPEECPEETAEFLLAFLKQG